MDNVATKFQSHPYLQYYPITVESHDDIKIIHMRDGDFVLSIFTLAATVSGLCTDVKWFEQILMQYIQEKTNSVPHMFVDAALSGCVISWNILDVCNDSYPDTIRCNLDSSLGLVQSGFKDYKLSSMIFLNDEVL